MKYILVVMSMFLTFSLDAQNVHKESYEMWGKINNSLIDALASFTEYPENHENTVKVFEQLKCINNLCKDFQLKNYKLFTQYDDEKINDLVDRFNNTQTLADTFEELLRNIAGYNSRGIAAPEMEIIIEPILIEMGWQKCNLNVICNDAYFCEYKYKGFKMMFVKSTRPQYNEGNGRSHFYTISVDFTYSNGGGGEYAVGGNLYRMIQFKDDKHPLYYNVIKATSKRITNE